MHTPYAHGAAGLYEPGVDPGLGFNLVSWGNFSNGAQVWENAVQSVFDAGFTEVSLSPLRFYTPGVGSIAATSGSGPELSHVAAGIVRAKSLGMRVTVNPFIEPVGFSDWRGVYNPTPGSAESNLFWNDYQQYLSDVASVAQAGGADSMTVGTELRAITRNAGNNAHWDSVINAVDARFTGSIGYAANWDNYNHPNVAAAIWEHPAIDFIGIDSYFTNMLTGAQADASGSYPNPAFIGQVEAAWNNKLDGEILPFAAARQGGAGLPVELTEVGYLPFNRTSRSPQASGGAADRDEQNMAFEGLMRALDGRLASGEMLAAHVWQWDMPGSAGSLWNMNPAGGNQPANQQTAQWLSAFAKGTNPGGVDPPAGATRVLYSFEGGLQGFYYPNFETQPASTLAQASGTGATDGAHSLAITKPTPAWTWDARVEMSGDQLQALKDALADNADDYLLEIDVTYRSDDLPVGLTDLSMHVAIETNSDGWNQAFPYAGINSRANQSFAVQVPLSAFGLSSGIASANLHLGFAGSFSGTATIFVDRIALTDTSFVAPNGDYNGDGVVDAADYTLWRDSLGQNVTAGQGADGDANGVVDAGDYDLWRQSFGAVVPPTAAASGGSSGVPEPGAGVLLMLAGAIAVAARNVM
ncbi:glycoside hydrolase family 113 [Pirellulimonas nuda]|nr:glycoside hydrolase TIM-barrel-like domain-containing protein [Pirellulimonas nuda]